MKQVVIALIGSWIFFLPIYGQSYNECVKKAFQYLATDSIEAAEQQFKEALKIAPKQGGNVEIYRHLGRIQEHQGKYKEAIRYYTKGLENAPHDLELRKARANIYLLTDQTEKAQSDYTDVLNKKANDEDALFMRAYIFTEQRLYRRARNDYEALLRINPAHDKARVGLVLLNEKDNRPREAMEQINVMIENAPQNALFFAVRAGMEQSRKQYEAAAADFSKAISLDPKNPDYLLSRASMYIETKQKKEAREDLKAALELGADPQEVASMVHLLK